MERRVRWALAISLVGIAIAGAIAMSLNRGAELGQGRFFRNQTYHFQTLRALGDIPFGGADTNEILETIKTVRAGDADSWHDAWNRVAEHNLKRAAAARDRHSKGDALMRAHNYLRTAEFLLAPDDPRRQTAWVRQRSAFYEGLATLGVEHERFSIPYGSGQLGAIYYPGPERAAERPLIVFFGGIDSTLEELYFLLASAAHRRGYPVLTFEGPGQGSALREHNLHFTHEWEKPTGAVIDAFLARHARPPKMVLVGASMGGYLAPRAAAFDPRFDGVVAYDVLFDMHETAQRYVPGPVRWLHGRGYTGLVQWMIDLKKLVDPDFRWAEHHGRWVMGTASAMETIARFKPYTLDGVAQRINADVLILAGADDHFIPVSQVGRFEATLTVARSVTTRIYDRASGGAEHCQAGAHTLWHQDFFDWIIDRYGAPDRPTASLTPAPAATISTPAARTAPVPPAPAGLPTAAG